MFYIYRIKHALSFEYVKGMLKMSSHEYFKYQ